MSLETEISRLQTAKSEIKTAIEQKDVAVPEETRLDGYAALVMQIRAGGPPEEFSAGDHPLMAVWNGAHVTSEEITDTGLKLNIEKTGTYRFKVPAASSSVLGIGGSPNVYLYRNGAQEASNTVSANTYEALSFDLACQAGDEIVVYASGISGLFSASVTCFALIACISWD